MDNNIIIVPLIICILSLLILFFRKDDVQKLGDTASSILTLILSSLWLPIWIFIQWLVGQLCENIKLGSLDSILLIIFRILFALVTLCIVLIEIYTNIRITWIKSKRKLSDETDINISQS